MLKERINFYEVGVECEVDFNDREVLKEYFDYKPNRVDIIRWLIERKLNIRESKKLKEQLGQGIFVNNGLRLFLDHYYDSNAYKAFMEAYPNCNFKPWEFKCYSRNIWIDTETRVSAVRWLFEEKLKISKDKIKDQLNPRLFRENGLGTLLTLCYLGDPRIAVKEAYPDIEC